MSKPSPYTTAQPQSQAGLDLQAYIDKLEQEHAYGSPACRTAVCQCPQSQRFRLSGHSWATRWLPWALLSLLAFGTFILFHCTSFAEYLGFGAANILKRQLTSGTGHNSTFMHNKYYLIVVFVGLAIVLVLAVCLSACCCRQSFKNPLCCPCYTCACCGGLACLECIACGLCLEGVSQVA